LAENLAVGATVEAPLPVSLSLCRAKEDRRWETLDRRSSCRDHLRSLNATVPSSRCRPGGSTRGPGSSP
jgi:hypothetical protein